MEPYRGLKCFLYKKGVVDPEKGHRAFPLRPKKKIAMFPPYRPGETFFLLTRAREKSTIPFFPFTLKFLFYFLRYSH